MSAGDEDSEYERREDEYEARAERRRRNRGCVCGLDGYPGTCPGADACPYAGIEEDEEDND